MIENPAVATEILEGILENTEEGTFVLKPVRDATNKIIDFEYLMANKAALQIVQKSEGEMLGKSMLEVFPGVQSMGLFEKYVQVAETGDRYDEEMFYDFDGLELWFKVIVFRIKEWILINFADITELKNTLLENKRSQKLYGTLVKCLPGVEMALIDRKYQVVTIEGNPFKTLIPDKKIEKNANLFQMLVKEDPEKLLSMLRSCFKGSSTRKEVASEEDLYRLTCVPIKEGKENIAHVLLISEDISIFRYSQNELRNKIYALESANESLEQFAYVASHDLQEPLRKIRAFGDRLSSKYADQLEGSGQDYIARMQNAAARMQTLINDLLKYSRVGRFREPFQSVNLQELVQDITNDLEAAISDSDAKIVINELPVLEGEPSQLRQLFQNLISNAIKFQNPGVPPEIVLSYTLANEKDLAELGIAENSGTYYRISVADNGIGFDEKYLDRIFNIFQRLHGRSEYTGTGIGLAICRKIAENHAGMITASSQSGRGSTFYVILPENQTTES